MKTFVQFIAESYLNFGDYNLEQKFHHYNALLFQNEVPACPVVWEDKIKVRGQEAAGLTTFMFNPNTRLMRPGTLKIAISTRFKRTEEMLDSTLIHEMIHAFLASHGAPDENHGFQFLHLARLCGDKVGFSIPKNDQLGALELTHADSVLTSAICFVRRDGKIDAAMFFGGTAFDEPHKQAEIKAFWGSLKVIPGTTEIWVMKIQTTLAAKYGMSKAINSTTSHVVNPSEALELAQHGQIMFRIVPGAAARSEVLESLPRQKVLVAMRRNIRRTDGTYEGAFFLASISQDPGQLEILKDRWLTYARYSYDVEILLTNTTALNGHNFTVSRKPVNSKYWYFKPDTVAEIRKDAIQYIVRQAAGSSGALAA